jgi:hypothetical protein
MKQPVTFRTLLISNGMTILFVALIVLVSSTSAHTLLQTRTSSSDTTTISYQGNLTDAKGQPINKTLPMTFKLYSTPTGGTALWTEQRTGSNAVPITNGLFSVSLGSVTSLPKSLFGEPLWLGIKVDSDAEMTPRERLDGGATTATIPRLLGEDTCNASGGCPHITEDAQGDWTPVKGMDSDDFIEATVTTSGRPLLVIMTARGDIKPTEGIICGFKISQNGEQKRHIELDRMAGAPQYFERFGCSGSYLISDLPAGTYTFRAHVYTGGRDNAKVIWGLDRQIAVFEF